jgi:hypothetical protein
MKHRGLNIVIFFKLSFLLVAQAAKTEDPFYIIAHMINSRAALDWAVSQGANGIENDLRFNDNGDPSVIEHGSPCDCLCPLTDDHICYHGLNGTCEGPAASNNAAVHMQRIASYDNISLYYVDSKVDSTWGSRLDKAGANVIPFIDNNLFNYGYKGKVIISTSKFDTYNYTQAAVKAANNSVNRERYFFTFDEEGDNYIDVMAMLSRLTNNRVYSTGTSGCLPKNYDFALQASVAGRNIGENGLTLAWTTDVDVFMMKYIDLGVHGLLTNRISKAKQVVNLMGLTLASPSTPIPVSTVNVPFPNKCSCDYHNGGCMISWRAPSTKACKCIAKNFLNLWFCEGSVVSCDVSQPKCVNPDESKEACLLGQGNCNGY